MTYYIRVYSYGPELEASGEFNICVQHASSRIGNFDTVTDNEANENTIFIYPNPSSGLFNLSMNENKVELIKIHSINGQEVETIGVTNKNSTINIDLYSYPEGIYTIQLITNSSVINKKLVIKR